MSKTKTIETGYVPRVHQAALHAALKRFSVVICHRRFGKTVFAVNEMIDQGLRLYTSKKLPRPRYAYIAPTYGQAKKISWDYLKAFTANIPGVTVNEAELRVDVSLFGDATNTLRFQLFGAENPASLKGIYLDGLILDEYADMSPKTWTEALRPALSDRKGWSIFIGTPKGRNHFYDIHEYAGKNPEAWYTKIYKASETGVIEPSELADAKRQMPEEEFNQEYECSFEGSTLGSYYGDLMRQARDEGRIRSVPYDPIMPVFTAWDLGIADKMVIWFYQKVFKEIHLIDYMEVDGKGIKDLIKPLREQPYIYDTHFWPHDGAARELSTGFTRQEVAEKLGLRPLKVGKKLPLQDGIDRVRMILSRCYFDEVKCQRGIICLEEYKKEWDDIKQVYSDKPLHNQYSHGADAFRTLGMTLDTEAHSQENLPDQADTDFDVFGRYRRTDRWAE